MWEYVSDGHLNAKLLLYALHTTHYTPKQQKEWTLQNGPAISNNYY